MKKIKLGVLAVALIAICSAFATTQPTSREIVYGWDGNQFIAVDTEEYGDTYRCDAGETFCTYEDESFLNPIGTEDKVFVPLTR